MKTPFLHKSLSNYDFQAVEAKHVDESNPTLNYMILATRGVGELMEKVVLASRGVPICYDSFEKVTTAIDDINQWKKTSL